LGRTQGRRLAEYKRVAMAVQQQQQEQQEQQQRQAGLQARLKRKKQIPQEENRHNKKRALTKLIHYFCIINLDLKIKPLKGQMGL
jgi:antibiotic biosynthesis monooxygenase (ABM) superfamily enzyme